MVGQDEAVAPGPAEGVDDPRPDVFLKDKGNFQNSEKISKSLKHF